MSLLLNHPNGDVTITELSGDTRRITTDPASKLFTPLSTCETDYPVSLIELILEIKGPEYLCDEISRDTDPAYVRADLDNDLSAYFSTDEFANRRILDFGCGSGASSLILSRMFPDSQIIGLELDENHLRIARARLAHYGYTNIEFVTSPSGEELPPDLGEFDFVIMSAVYEHLLPRERTTVIPLLWSSIEPGGFLFLNMTPHRWFPIEHHTTGLPLLNYLPDALALPAARAFSKRIDKAEPWEMLLRRGIRGATEKEIVGIIAPASDHKPLLMEPDKQGLSDRIDLWYAHLNHTRHVLSKKMIKSAMKALKAATGVTLVPNLSLVIRKSL
jgi:2-polyprenyl-3-methyl-5-hydroxy-6-metoxy-1,4-benzoquinol methylase